MIKDDVLGIGAKKSEDHECTGLDVFQDLLGRLNGKDEGEVEKGREAREKSRRDIIVGERYRMRFVLGEVYQSSDIEQLLKKQGGERGVADIKEEVRVGVMKEEYGVAVKVEGLKVEEVEGGRKKEKSRKRKIEVVEEVDGEEEKRRRKKEKKEKKNKKEKKDKKDKKGKKGKKGKEDKEMRKDRDSEKSGTTTLSGESEEPLPSILKKSKKSKEVKESPKDRKDVKKEREQKKEKRNKKDKRKRKESNEFSPRSSSEEEGDTPEVAAVATARLLTGRRAIRHKYIAAKRSAVMDVQALNEVRVSLLPGLSLYI